jgi:hypothetical protein
MASITCKCGNRLSNSEVPNDIQYHVYSDREWDKILENDFIEMIKFPRSEHDIWKCGNCHRIYVFNQNGEIIKIYLLESNNPVQPT